MDFRPVYQNSLVAISLRLFIFVKAAKGINEIEYLNDK
jgi:hypothetical protein